MSELQGAHVVREDQAPELPMGVRCKLSCDICWRETYVPKEDADAAIARHNARHPEVSQPE